MSFVQATAGAAGGVFASFVLMPLEVVKTRVQISQVGEATLSRMLIEIVKSEGVAGLFRGVSSKCSETGSKNFVFFYIYDTIGGYVKFKTQIKITPTVSLVLGYFAGLGTTILTMPLEVLSTRQQVGKAEGGFFACLNDLLQEEGIPGLFKGFWFNVLLCINPAIQNTCFDRIKDALLLRKSGGDISKRVSMTPVEAFMLGALAKAVATVVTFPLVRLKTMLQAGKPIAAPMGEDGEEAPDSLKRTASTGGFTGELVRRMSFRSDLAPRVQGYLLRFCELYRGMGPSLLKGVLQAAVLYATKDQVAKVVRVLLAAMIPARYKFRALSGRPLAS